LSDRRRDAVVVGGGPAGLAFAAAAAWRGLDVTVLEARPYPVDKACGEGILPAGVRALEALGVRHRLGPGDATPLTAIRWIDAGPGAGAPGAVAEAPLPSPGGLGVRRTALSAALLARAREAGAEVLEAEAVGHRRAADEVAVETAAGEVRARLLVAADGLASPVRRREGLDRPVGGPRRFGLRRHLSVEPWSDAVEVHLADGVEAYLTPSGAGRLGVAFLFEREAPGGWPALLARFPALEARLAGAPAASAERGAGPLARTARARVLDRLVLLGDAAGYLDAITGEGLSLSLACALDLAALAPDAIARGAGTAALLGYERAWRRRWRPYWLSTAALLAVTRRPALRRSLLGLCAREPRPLARLVAAAVG
jgi:flavin-dependent dehydrogenase